MVPKHGSFRKVPKGIPVHTYDQTRFQKIISRGKPRIRIQHYSHKENVSPQSIYTLHYIDMFLSKLNL